MYFIIKLSKSIKELETAIDLIEKKEFSLDTEQQNNKENIPCNLSNEKESLNDSARIL